MRHSSLFWGLLASAILSSSSSGVLAQRRPSKRNHDTHDYYVVEHKPDGGAPLQEISNQLGVELVERVGELDDVWLVRAPKPTLQGRGEEEQVDRVLQTYQNLRALARRQAESSTLDARSEGTGYEQATRLVSSISHLEKQVLKELEKRAPPPIRPPPGPTEVMDKYKIEDPFFIMQWHLANGDYPEHMMNVTPVWDMGYTGKGVITSILDDGLDYTSEDLKDNFDPDNSYDFNDHEALPYPKRVRDHHGTRCAGQIAAGKNKACGVGIAYESKVAGVRILSGRITTVDEAAAINYGFQNVSIYSCSWGPRDDGTKMQTPPYIVRKAVLNGINKGRGGKGSIFVFASGNGAHKGDQCNFDGYTNSIYSVTVGAVDFRGQHPKYSEACAANMVVAYSSGSGQHIVTTDRGKDECALVHGGTSAAAPNVAGVFALALQARPDLTWRDIQYLCVETARQINPKDRDWERTATGRYYSYKYGYGVLDASLYVQRALTWKLVKPQAWLETPTIQLDGGTLDAEDEWEGGTPIGKEGVKSKMTITKKMMQDANLESLEHVTIKVWIDHTRRGDVEVAIVSPNGIRSVLAGARERDDSMSGFPGWTFMSVKHWGEDPVGDWTIHVTDQQSEVEEGAFLGWNMILWGTTVDPSKAKFYEMDPNEKLLPPNRSGTITPQRPELPGSHTENPKPTGAGHAIEGKPTAELPHDSTSPDKTLGDANAGKKPENKGWIGGLKDKAAKQTWLAGIIGVLVLANIAGAIYFCCWKKGCGDGEKYNALPGEENVPMSSINGGQYDQDGERTALVGGGDEEEDGVDTRPAARAQQTGPHPQARSTGGLGFHSGFLDDDDPMTAASPRYKDGSVVQSAVGELIPTGDAPAAAAMSSSSGPQPSVQQQPRNLVESSEEEEDDEDDDDEDDEDEDEDDEESSEEDSGSQQPLQQNQVRRPGEVDSSASLI
ncbi:kex protein [Coprinopsis cinerea okayama7|uniref:Kex protein n=1 Tax=Coprinopsis cinerea (strain Okayama-7 / 130 / ATCC MYA-4618 / FGSC 9003) TaxID=240176 RepID=A8NIA2_COPC7|nr:kex protein [Coprinopsis cinerea okayama7\|eukprot:XP_001833948.1 kex protein [Coprinopsis cinerea okayama7\